MANLKEITRKIKSVKNTQKTTKAMKLVSTAKLMRAKMAVERSKEFAIRINDLLGEIVYKVNLYKDVTSNNPYFNGRDVKVVDIIFVTADKGLCGGFNQQTIKEVSKLLNEYEEKNIEVRLRGVGRKGVEFFKFNGVDLTSSFIGVSANPTEKKAYEIIEESISDFNDGKCDKIVLIHNGYKNMITQDLKTKILLPIEIKEGGDSKGSALEIEPNGEEEEILSELVKKYIEFNSYFALIDSLAAEHSARMQAMDAATNNANDRANQLTLEFNKARQEAITTELVEIISGVESLK